MRETVSTKKKKKKSANKTKTKTKQKKKRNQNNNKKPQAPASQPGNSYHVLEVNIDHSLPGLSPRTPTLVTACPLGQSCLL